MAKLHGRPAGHEKVSRNKPPSPAPKPPGSEGIPCGTYTPKNPRIPGLDCKGSY